MADLNTTIDAMRKVLRYSREYGVALWIVVARVGDGVDVPVCVVEEVLHFVAEDFVVAAD